MDEKALFTGLLSFVAFIMIVTFHEFGHAWTAMKLGDDTAYHQGRVTLNPIAHIDFFGTIFLPLLAVMMGAYSEGMGALLLGWGKPVPVNVGMLQPEKRRFYDTLITLAGPAMNIILAFLAMLIIRILIGIDGSNFQSITSFGQTLCILSVYLFFFNLVPIPPLDGGHVLKNLLGLSEEQFMRFSQYGFIILIILINIPPVNHFLGILTFLFVKGLALLFGIPM